MKFLRVAQVDMIHDFYTSGACPDLNVQPDPATEKLLRNHRHIARARANGIDVFAGCPVVDTASGEEPLLPLPPATKLVFWLRLRNPEFPMFTDLSGHEGLGPRLGYACSDAGTASPTTIEELAKDRFFVAQSQTSEKFILKAVPRDGAGKIDFAVTSNDIVHVSSYSADTNVLSVNTSAALVGAEFFVSYPIKTRKIQGVFAELVLDASNWSLPTPDQPKKFEIRFDARKAIWTYVVIAQKLSGKGRYSIEDTGPDGLKFRVCTDDEVIHPDATTTQNSQAADQRDTIAQFRFRSVNPISCAQKSKAGIQLFKSSSAPTVTYKSGSEPALTPTPGPTAVLMSLPNPTWRVPARLKTSDGKTVDVFTQTIKYLPQRILQK